MSEGSAMAQIMAPNAANDYWKKFDQMTLGQQLREIERRIREGSMGSAWERPDIGALYGALKLPNESPAWVLAQRESSLWRVLAKWFTPIDVHIATVRAVATLAELAPADTEVALATLP